MGAGETVWWTEARAALAEGQSAIVENTSLAPNIHTRQIPATCNTSPQGIHHHWPSQAPALGHMPTLDAHIRT